MEVRAPFPPISANARYAFEVQGAAAARAFIAARWRSLYEESLAGAGVPPGQLAHWFFHQTHGAQVTSLLAGCGVPLPRTVPVVTRHGNMGTPTFACALARGFAQVRPGDRYLLQAVGGGISWAAIVAEHR
jgi:3-oxoacyl-[acyl-carrier-protein] synthase-3